MKPVLVGLSNPYSRDPACALAPYPERSAGHRLWRMMGDVDSLFLGADSYNASAFQGIYMDAFDRRNLFDLHVPRSEPLRLLAATHLVRSIPEGSTVVLLGGEVRACVAKVLTEPLRKILIHPQHVDSRTWRCLPHPSGRTTLYNDPVARMLAGMVLADCLEEAQESRTWQRAG